MSWSCIPFSEPQRSGPVREILDGVPNVKLLARWTRLLVACMQRGLFCHRLRGIQERTGLGQAVLSNARSLERPEAIAAEPASRVPILKEFFKAVSSLL